MGINQAAHHNTGTYNKRLWLWTERGQIPEYANRMLQNTFSEKIEWFRVTFREINESRIVLLNNAIAFSTPYQITENDNFRIDQNHPLIFLFEWMIEQMRTLSLRLSQGSTPMRAKIIEHIFIPTSSFASFRLMTNSNL